MMWRGVRLYHVPCVLCTALAVMDHPHMNDWMACLYFM